MFKYNEEAVAAVTDEEIAELDAGGWCLQAVDFMNRFEARRRLVEAGTRELVAA